MRIVLMIKGVREIFKNDIKAVKNNPVVFVVLLAIILIPSLYALLNIQATWDPYSLTSNIKVAVANGDSGYYYNGTQYNMGSMLVDELKNNEKFNWQFVDEENARTGVENGDYYAALIIPGNFSQQILSINTSNPQSAQIEYLVNDKLNAIVPRMTNAGADALQTQINDEVIKTIDGIIFGKLSNLGELVAENKADILKTKAFVNELNGKLGTIDANMAELNSDMDTVNKIWPQIYASLPEVQEKSHTVKNSYDSLYTQIKNDPQKALETVQSMETNLNNILSTLKYTDAYLITLYNATGDPKLQPIIAQVEDNIGKVNKTLTILKKLEEAIKDSNNPSGMLAELKTSIDKMDDAINLLANNRDAINQKIITASSKLDLVNTKWPTIRSAIQTASLKLNSISEADLDSMIEFSNMNQDDVKNYFESPVELNKKHVYNVDNYGSALSPFYISVSLWIGCIIAVAMITMRVKTRKKYSAETIYLGRMGLFLIISIMQALVVAVGALMLGIQVSSALLFTLTTLYIGLCLMVVIYSLTSAFGNAGKAIAIILLVLQITATGGTFPVEILPSFFQAIHPYLPLTYAIGALREVVAGVLWSNFWYCIGILALFPALAFGLTLLIKERMDKRAQWAENKLKESGLF